MRSRLFISRALSFFIFTAFANGAFANGALSSESNLDQSIERYQSRYGLKNVDDKTVDNYGRGYEGLYGTRNFRVVLNGVVYRGGANNAYHRDQKRNNSNPLPSDGLKNLCEEGFDQSVYLYSTRFNTAPRQTSCRTRFGQDNLLQYQQVSPLNSDSGSVSILRMVHAKLTSRSGTSPMYLHCWNGWHASGYISALILKQFCSYSSEEAVAYWDRNTDGNNAARTYEKIRTRIRNFEPLPELQISKSLQAKVCL